MVQRSLKGIALVVVAVVIVFIVIRINSWINPPHENVTVTVPKDTAFAPVWHDRYQPPSLPFSGKKFPVKLPRNVPESDVSRIITVEPTGTSHELHIIETKDGDIYIEKDSTIRKVTVTTIDPPLFSFGTRFGAGLSVTRRNDRAVFSPVVVYAPVEWSGWIHAPIAVADLEGIGLGAQFKVYHDIHLGGSHLWRYDEGTALKLTATFMF